MSPERITELELIQPSLYILNLNGGAITTRELIPKLRQIMKPSGEDLKILSGRTDDKFSQKVRNLKAHDTFERFGYAAYQNGVLVITQAGVEHLNNNQDILTYLLINDFTYSDLTENLQRIETTTDKRRIETFDENIIIQEGIKSITQKEVYERSKMLRDYALEYYTKDGRIDCTCCTFNFSDFYGGDMGSNFIEMHHVKPIFKYEGDEFVKTIKEAVLNLTPVCSNCHRMIHRNWSKPREIQELIDGVNSNGIFRRYAQ